MVKTQLQFGKIYPLFVDKDRVKSKTTPQNSSRSHEQDTHQRESLSIC